MLYARNLLIILCKQSEVVQKWFLYQKNSLFSDFTIKLKKSLIIAMLLFVLPGPLENLIGMKVTS